MACYFLWKVEVPPDYAVAENYATIDEYMETRYLIGYKIITSTLKNS